MTRNIGLYVGAGIGVVLAGVALVAALDVLPAVPRAQLNVHQEIVVEVAKAAIGVFPLAFFGVFVGDIVRRRDERRAKDEKRDEFRLRFLTDLVLAYNRVKSVRRSLRGAGFAPGSGGTISKEQLEFLNSQVTELSEGQLDLELLKDEALARQAVFTRSMDVIRDIGALEGYVNRVVKDWEDGRSRLGAGSSMADVWAWASFRAFLAGVDDNGSFGDASALKRRISSAIWPDLLP